jgi:hypothetical protein
MKSSCLATLLALISLAFRPSEGLDKEMTIVVSAKEKECFYERVPENFIIDLEYQVRKIIVVDLASESVSWWLIIIAQSERKLLTTIEHFFR